jgi:hypothetical protein
MGLIEWYLLFALTTAIMAAIDVFIPLLSEARSNGVANVLTTNFKLSIVVYLGISTLMAPLLIVPLLVPSMNERFKDALNKIISEQE